MKFYEYRDAWPVLKKTDLCKQMEVQDRTHLYTMLNFFSSEEEVQKIGSQIGPDAWGVSSLKLSMRHYLFDKIWHEQNCPYYDVYPSIVPILTKISLDIPGDSIVDTFIKKPISEFSHLFNEAETITEHSATIMKQDHKCFRAFNRSHRDCDDMRDSLRKIMDGLYEQGVIDSLDPDTASIVSSALEKLDKKEQKEILATWEFMHGDKGLLSWLSMDALIGSWRKVIAARHKKESLRSECSHAVWEELVTDDNPDTSFAKYKSCFYERHGAVDGVNRQSHIPNLLVRLSKENNQFKFTSDGQDLEIRSIFMSFQPVHTANGLTHGLVVGMDIGETIEGLPVYTVKVFPLDGSSVEESINELATHQSVDAGIQIPNELVMKCVKLCITLRLIGNDPDLIQPDVLSKDRDRWRTGDDELRARLQDKAKRRGKNGFLIGSLLDSSDVSPHIRKPHIALYWTGKGRKVPKILMRKGAVIHRSKIEKIPTGYKTE